MPKNIEDIVVSSKKKSIRDIPIPENRRRSTDRRTASEDRRKSARRTEDKEEEKDEAEAVMPRITSYKPDTRVRRRRKHPGRKALFSIVAAFVVLIFASMAVFGGATLTYTPKSAPLSFAGESFSASKTGEGGLVYSVVKLSGDKSKEVPATGEEEVQRKASGTIVVYNSAGTAPQPLVATTRFETADGKVYRIDKDIVVPGRKVVGGDIVPGSVEVVVYADQPGDEYNIDLTDFTLPGLRGTSKYQTVYARSKTPMSGGFVGMAKAVSEDDLSSARAELEAALRDELASQAKAQVPGDFVLFPSLSSYTFEELPQTEADDDSVNVNLRGNFYGVMFKRSDLASYIASGKASLAEGDEVDIQGLESLAFSFDGAAPADLLASTEISFRISGDATLVWKTNEDSLRNDLLGADKSQIGAILNNYPSVASADAVVRPFWKKSFPDEPKDISIERKSVQ